MADDTPAPPSLNTNSQLQVGIEIEFVAPPDTAWEAARLPAGPDRRTRTSLGRDACLHRLAGALHGAGLPASCQITTTPLQCPHKPLCDAAPPDAIVVLGGRYLLFGNPLRLRRCDGPAELFQYWLVKPERDLTDVPAYHASLPALRPGAAVSVRGNAAQLRPPHAIPPTEVGTALSSRARAHIPPDFAVTEAWLALIWRDDATWDDLQRILEHRDCRADPRIVAPVLCKHKPALGGRGHTNTTIEFRHAQASFSHRFVWEWVRLVLAIGRVALLPVNEYCEALGRLGEAAAARGGEGASMAVLRELSAVAVKAGMPGSGLDLAYWSVRYDQMRAEQNPDIDGKGKAVLGDDGAGA